MPRPAMQPDRVVSDTTTARARRAATAVAG